MVAVKVLPSGEEDNFTYMLLATSDRVVDSMTVCVTS